jgi:hypothetical protein
MNNVMLSVLILVLSLGCTKSEDDFYVRKKRILGDWICKTSEVKSVNGLIVNTVTSELNLTFEDEERVYSSSNAVPGAVTQHTWYYQLDPEKVIIQYEPIGFLIKPNNYFSVTKNERNNQLWEEIIYAVTPTGDDIETHITWNLTRN